MKWLLVLSVGGLAGILYAAYSLKRHFPFREAAPPLKQLLSRDPRDDMWN